MKSSYGPPCELGRLPISPASRVELARLSAWYQSSIDWNYPPVPSPWSDRKRQLFKEQAHTALETLRSELGEGWKIVGRKPVVRSGAVVRQNRGHGDGTEGRRAGRPGAA